MKKIFKIIIIVIVAIACLMLIYFFVGWAPEAKKITWGVNFSQMQAENLKLDWKETYLALLQDLGVKHLKLLTQWDFIEGQQGKFYFNDIDWQITEAKKYNADILYVLGMKSGRWPECHIPTWAQSIAKDKQQEAILGYITHVINRYKNSKVITAWQAENEPLFRFGHCPWYDKDFLKKEVALIKSLDPSRPVIISDSGEQSLWLSAAKIGDIVGVTMYKKVWVHITDNLGFPVTFPLPAVTYYRKAKLINYFFGKPVISTELQAEPWASKVFYNVPLAEQAKTMNVKQFQYNITFAKQTGLSTFYLWGSEWWFWLKEIQGNPEMWGEAKKLF